VNEWHLLWGSGGTAVTVIGKNMDAAVEPIITVTVVVTEFNSTDDKNNITTPFTSQTTVNSEVLCCDSLYHYQYTESTCTTAVGALMLAIGTSVPRRRCTNMEQFAN